MGGFLFSPSCFLKTVATISAHRYIIERNSWNELGIAGNGEMINSYAFIIAQLQKLLTLDFVHDTIDVSI